MSNEALRSFLDPINWIRWLYWPGFMGVMKRAVKWTSTGLKVQSGQLRLRKVQCWRRRRLHFSRSTAGSPFHRVSFDVILLRCVISILMHLVLIFSIVQMVLMQFGCLISLPGICSYFSFVVVARKRVKIKMNWNCLCQTWTFKLLFLLFIAVLQPALVEEWSKSPCFKFKYRQKLRSQVWIPVRDYDSDCSELDLTCCYSNSRALGGGCTAYDIQAPNQSPP